MRDDRFEVSLTILRLDETPVTCDNGHVRARAASRFLLVRACQCANFSREASTARRATGAPAGAERGMWGPRERRRKGVRGGEAPRI